MWLYQYWLQRGHLYFLDSTAHSKHFILNIDEKKRMGIAFKTFGKIKTMCQQMSNESHYVYVNVEFRMNYCLKYNNTIITIGGESKEGFFSLENCRYRFSPKKAAKWVRYRKWFVDFPLVACCASNHIYISLTFLFKMLSGNLRWHSKLRKNIYGEMSFEVSAILTETCLSRLVHESAILKVRKCELKFFFFIHISFSQQQKKHRKLYNFYFRTKSAQKNLKFSSLSSKLDCSLYESFGEVSACWESISHFHCSIKEKHTQNIRRKKKWPDPYLVSLILILFMLDFPIRFWILFRNRKQ